MWRGSRTDIGEEMGKNNSAPVLILVKTYPHRSAKYVETVCTAGIRADGTWVRLFPIPFRIYNDEHKFKKYQWVECSYYKAAHDPRPESQHVDLDLIHTMKLGDVIPTENQWNMRREMVLDKVEIFTRLSDLKDLSSSNRGSLAVFRPTSVKLKVERAIQDDEDGKAAPSEVVAMQLDLWHSNDWMKDFRRVEPVPYNFKYQIVDADGHRATHKILDWELGALFFNEKKRLGSEEAAKMSVMHKYGDEFLNRDKIDLHLYMGTMLKFQQKHMENPWSIIGVAPFPVRKASQLELGL